MGRSKVDSRHFRTALRETQRLVPHRERQLKHAPPSNIAHSRELVIGQRTPTVPEELNRLTKPMRRQLFPIRAIPAHDLRSVEHDADVNATTSRRPSDKARVVLQPLVVTRCG
jgi:hypothetical protein